MAALAVAGAVVGFAGEQQPFSTTTTAVTVDVVVRDKGGAFVQELQREDFTVLEDDAPQTISAFAVESGRNATRDATPDAGRPPSASAAPAANATSPSYVALVFGRLSPEARSLADKAARTYLELRAPQDFTGVFTLDRSLLVAQDFTFDGPTLKAAIQKASTRSARIDETAFTPLMRSGPNESTRMAGVGTDSDYESQQVLGQLTALVRAMAGQPGRKSVVLFTETFDVYPGTEPYFQALMDTASRANVTFYPMDASGLRTFSPEGETATELNQTVRGSIDQNTPISMDQVAMLAGRVRSGNVPAILSVLAHETGGFPVVQTNNLAGAFQSINEDRRQYYVLSYSPTNTNFHGEYRRITVRVNRPGVVVRARAGYFAISEPAAEPAAPFEYSAVAALSQTPSPHDIPVRVGAFVFPLPDGTAEVPVLIQAPAAAVTFEQAENGYRTDVTILALIRNREGVVVQKGSRVVRLTPAANRLTEAKGADLQFYRQPRLSAGDYTLEASIADALARRAGVAKATFSVPRNDGDGPRVSSLVIIDATVPLPESKGAPPVDAVVVGRQLLIPNIGAPISKRDHPKVTYVFTIASAQKSDVQARLELTQGGQTLGAVGLTLPAPDEHGTIRYAGQLPAAQLSPGVYRARVIVTAAGRQTVRETPFTLAE